MPREVAGTLAGAGLRIGIVVSRFNQTVTEPLLDGALAALQSHGVDDDAVDVVRVPGAFEVPFAARCLAARGDLHAMICLGAIVRGETPHFDYLATEVTRGLGDVMGTHRLPVAFGVLTTDTMAQALARAGEGHGNKGYEAAVTAIEMADLARRLA